MAAQLQGVHVGEAREGGSDEVADDDRRRDTPGEVHRPHAYAGRMVAFTGNASQGEGRRDVEYGQPFCRVIGHQEIFPCLAAEDGAADRVLPEEILTDSPVALDAPEHPGSIPAGSLP